MKKSLLLASFLLLVSTHVNAAIQRIDFTHDLVFVASEANIPQEIISTLSYDDSDFSVVSFNDGFLPSDAYSLTLSLDQQSLRSDAFNCFQAAECSLFGVGAGLLGPFGWVNVQLELPGEVFLSNAEGSFEARYVMSSAAATLSAVPLPAAAWFFASSLIGLVLVKKKR